MIALTTTSIAWLIFAVVLTGWVIYAILNLRQSRDELGSEIELAANRKPYYDDEDLFVRLVRGLVERGFTDIGLYSPIVADQEATFERLARTVIPELRAESS